MRKLLPLASFLLLFTACQTEPWQTEMVRRLDSMVVLSESHQQVIASVDSAEVHQAYLEMGEYTVFFTDHLEDMQALEIPKSVYTGPLYEMENCVKYFGRVVGSFANESEVAFNLDQLKSLRKDVNAGLYDSTEAVGYFNSEAFALRDADRSVNKSYGACFSCLRTHEELTAELDSLKDYILAANAIN